MTNLTDEGLTDMAGGIAEFHLKSDCSCEWERQCRVCGLSWGILEALKQVRDAAKKEMKEMAAVVAENYLVTNKQYAGVATAIRQME